MGIIFSNTRYRSLQPQQQQVLQNAQTTYFISSTYRELLADHLGHYIAGCDAISGDSLTSILTSGAEGKSSDRSLGHRVRRASRQTAGLPRPGGHVDNAAPLLLLHVGDTRLGHEKRAINIDSHNFPPLRSRCFDHLIVGQYA